MKITFEDKEALRDDSLPRKNKITAEDINEIKRVVNANDSSGNALVAMSLKQLEDGSLSIKYLSNSKSLNITSLQTGVGKYTLSGFQNNITGWYSYDFMNPNRSTQYQITNISADAISLELFVGGIASNSALTGNRVYALIIYKYD